MCTVLLAHQCLAATPLLLVANRDERRHRPTRAPHLWRPPAPPIAAGRDLVAGGTWLGLNRHQVVAAVLNRRGGLPDPRRRTRGELPVAALRHESAAAAARWLERIDPAAYNPFTLLVADRSGCWITEGDGRVLTVRRLPPGPHLLTTAGLGPADDDEGDRVEADLAAAVAGADPARCLRHFAAASRRHGRGDGGPALCHHGRDGGTVSSAWVRLGADGRARYDHGAGPPCRGRLRPVHLGWG